MTSLPLHLSGKNEGKSQGCDTEASDTEPAAKTSNGDDKKTASRILPILRLCDASGIIPPLAGFLPNIRARNSTIFSNIAQPGRNESSQTALGSLEPSHRKWRQALSAQVAAVDSFSPLFLTSEGVIKHVIKRIVASLRFQVLHGAGGFFGQHSWRHGRFVYAVVDSCKGVRGDLARSAVSAQSGRLR